MGSTKRISSEDVKQSEYKQKIQKEHHWAIEEDSGNETAININYMGRVTMTGPNRDNKWRLTSNKREHPVKEHTMIFMDETGDLGKVPKKNGKIYRPTKTFSVGVSVVDDPDRFAEVSRAYRKNTGRRDEK